MNDTRLRRLTERVERLQSDAQFLTVKYLDGTEETVPAENVILMLCGPNKDNIADVIRCSGNHGGGMLPELLRGIVLEKAEVTVSGSF